MRDQEITVQEQIERMAAEFARQLVGMLSVTPLAEVSELLARPPDSEEPRERARQRS